LQVEGGVLAEEVDDGVCREGLVTGGDEVYGAVAFGEGEGFEGGGYGDALGDGGGFCLWGGVGLLGPREGGSKAEEGEKGGDFSLDCHLAMIARNGKDTELVLFRCK
jgi:hypothetical protein